VSLLSIHITQVEAISKQIYFGGSDFAARAFNGWTSEYLLQNPNYTINYDDTIGYTEAVNLLLNNTNVIASSDIPLDESYYVDNPDLQMFPIVGAAIVPYYTFIQVGLVLSRDAIARIFMGNITRWNDTAIQLTNPAAVLTSAPITVVYRTDDSVATYCLTQALSSFNSDWAKKYGVSQTFPMSLRSLSNFRGAEGERGVAALSKLVQNAFSYVSSNLITETLAQVQYARILNKNGTRADVKVTAMEPVLAASQPLFNSRFTANIVDLPVVAGFPIMTYTYLVVRMTTTPEDRCDELKVFLQFIDFALNYTTPNITALNYGYATLPSNIVDLVRQKLFQITCAGVPLLTADEVPSPAPGPVEMQYTSRDTFSGLTSVPYVPFYNYLGSTISASQASTLLLSTLSTLYNNNPGANSSSSSKLTPSLLPLTILIMFVYMLVGVYEPAQSSSSRRSSTKYFGFLATLLIIFGVAIQSSDATVINLGGVYPVTSQNAVVGSQMESVSRVAVLDLNAIPNANFTFVINNLDEGGTLSEGDTSAILSITKYFSTVVIGGYDSSITGSMAAVTQSYLTPFLSSGARGNTLSQGNYPLFSRVIPPYKSEGGMLAAVVKYYGWENTVAFIASSDDYGIDTSKVFKAYLSYYGSSVLAEERYFAGDSDFSDQLSKIRTSLARVIVILASSPSDAAQILMQAEEYHLIGDQFVWLTGSPSSTSDLFFNHTTDVLDPTVKQLGAGLIGVKLKGGYGDLYDQFLDQWETLSSVTYAGAGKRSIATEAVYTYDAFLLTADAVSKPFVTLDDIINNLRTSNVTGLTGPLNLNGTEDRLGIFDIVNLQKGDSGDMGWVVVGDWYEENKYDPNYGITFDYNIQFHDGTIIIPSLIIHNKLTYWSCSDKKMKTDDTGKEVRLDAPGPDADNIDKQYRCDQFIDCYNLSDEVGCTPSMPAGYIAIGIILGISILFAIVCILFTILFGYLIRRRRVRTASPLFLIIIACSCIVGFGSDYAYFGQDSPVSCIFRMWLVTVAVITMISSLFIKSFRVWRLYRSKSKIVPMPDWQLVILVILMVIPVIVIDIIWSIVATPTASLIDIAGEKHYVCHAGGFTGDPIGYVFFALDIAYIGLILCFGVFLSIVTRNIISTFNESRLIAVSTYNLFFLGVIGIPVYLVLKESNPLASWVIYEVCILYGFLSTLSMQFIPKMYGIVIIDKFKNTNLQLDEVNSQNTATNSAAADNSSNPNALF